MAPLSFLPAKPAKAPTLYPPPPRPIPAALAPLLYVGIPRGVLTWQPKLPSRNWLIFLTVTSTLTYAYYDDRNKAKKLKESYKDRVRWMGEQRMGSDELPRKVKVYASRWPEDEDEHGMKYFKRYIKPILNAAAVDYDLVPTTRYGALTRKLSAEIHKSRRTALGLLPPAPVIDLPGGPKDPVAEAQRVLDGGVVIIGRATLKEYMAGLNKGWFDEIPEKEIGRDEILANILSTDGVFDKPEDERSLSDAVLAGLESGEEPIALVSKLPPSSSTTKIPTSAWSPFASTPAPPVSDPSATASGTIPPRDILPAQPSITLVPFTNMLGFKQIPLMLFDFFRETKHVRIGGEAAMKILLGDSREIRVPFGYGLDVARESNEESPMSMESTSTGGNNQGMSSAEANDLDFDTQSESFYKKSFIQLPETNTSLRTTYYKNLIPRLATARELSSGSREPTKNEVSNPPPTEIELREERFRKERRWRDEEEGYAVILGDSVAWDERMRELKVVVDPSKEKGELERLEGDRRREELASEA